MVIVLVLVVLAVAGGAAAFFMRSKKGSESSAQTPPAMRTIAKSSPPESRSSSAPPVAKAPPATKAPPVTEAPPVTKASPNGVAPPAVDADDTDEDDEDEGPILDRFAARGQRVVATTEYRPTTPRKPTHLADTLGDGGEPAPEPASEVEPEIAPAPAPEPVSEVEPDISPAPTPGPAAEVVLVDTEPVVDVSGDGAARPDVAAEGVDQVLQALIGRAQFTHRDLAEVAAELVDRADLDAEEVAEVLTDLVERAEAGGDAIASAERLEELTLFSEEVPRRPGQMTDFADLADKDRRRVIIRVLCLLVARSEDQKLTPKEPASEAETRQWPLSRAVWPLPAPEVDDDVDLPARRHGLARLRR